MKLLFLDIDGVMTSNSLTKESGFEEKLYPFSKSSVTALNEVLKSNKVKIILTSTWRTAFDVDKQCQIFKENGVSQMPAGETVDLGFENRSMEIRGYLGNRDVEGFDDHFLRIDPRSGLTISDVQETNRKLKLENLSTKNKA